MKKMMTKSCDRFDASPPRFAFLYSTPFSSGTFFSKDLFPLVVFSGHFLSEDDGFLFYSLLRLIPP
jgi:hypothetical protein